MAADLSAVSTDDLLAELHRRPLVVCVFQPVDFQESILSAVEDELEAESISDDRLAEASLAALLEAKSMKMEDRLSERGNDFIGDMLDVSEGSEIRRILSGDPSPAP